ncbi:MAG: thioredoxin family protein [bacterium]|nr:thioredoxin family protein [bacterium]
MVRTASESKKLVAGDSAPDFKLAGTDDKIHALADFGAYEGLLIVFMCNHCPYVQAKTDDLVKLHAKFGDRLAVVGINSNDPDYPGEGMELMKAFAEERGIRFPYLLDDTQQTARAYGATCTPDPFLFDKDRRLVFHGKITDAMNPGDKATEETMKTAIEKMLAGEKIEKWFDPSLGCSIKWIEK